MSYVCSACNKTYEGKAWITINTEKTVITCSYLCYKKCLDHIPKKHFHLIQNMEDFNEPRPVFHTQPPEPPFQFLTETEINKLTDEEYYRYKLDLDEHCLLNPARSQVYHEGLENDAHALALEGEGEEEFMDDNLDDEY